jgi:hypothetical protein
MLHTLLWLAAAALAPLGAGCGSSAPIGEPPLGASDFVSAAGQQGQPTAGGDKNGFSEGAAAAPSADGSGTRTVEEGDIYRVLAPERLLNLNSYRGLQVIDLSDVSAPKVMGRVAVTGYPVEMYVVDQRAYVLLNNWYGYYGTRTDVHVEAYQGGLVLAVDLTDPAHPTITGRAEVPGNIVTSRLTRGGGKEALFVAASNWNGQSATVVRSFAVSGAGKLEERSTIDLGGWVVDVAATPQALLVARSQYDASSYYTSSVAVIDISDPEGGMVEGASIPVAGSIKDKNNMDLYRGVLRVASGSQWGGTGAHLETFNVTDIQAPAPIDHQTFGDGQDLYATVFLANKAFCVTYRRVDPLHAFAITDDGLVTPKAEFVITGWNDFFTPVADDTRLIGVGVDDQGGRNMAVSLYDITDLANPNPFVGRASVEFDSSWSEAQWDDRAFSVLENAVEIPSATGVTETGLVLLPFTGYNYDGGAYVAGVQIFTFSPTTLTKRGVMDHGTQVRRSFMQSAGVTANLSEQKLSLYDAQNPDSPLALGKLDLAPNYMDFFVFGGYGARLKYDVDYYRWWGTQTDLPDNQLQIIPLGADPDLATPIAVVSLPARAQLFQVGSLAVAVTTTYVENSNPAQYSSDVRVYDLSDPTSPQLRGTLTTDKIQPAYGYWYGGMGDCWDCGRYYWYYGNLEAQVAGAALVFPARQWQNELLGNEHVCYSYPNEPYQGDCSGAAGATCSYVTGNITCSSLNGAPQTCAGGYSRCSSDAAGKWTCEKLEPSAVQTQTYCYDQQKYRYWSNLTLSALDLRDPAQPAMAADLTMPTTEDDASVLAKDAAIYVTFRVPVTIPGDSRPFVRYYFKKVDLTDPQHPTVGTPVNIPGELIMVDGATIYTRDTVWGQNIVEAAINRLQVLGDHAFLQARRRFQDQEVHTVLLDGAGHVLVSHGDSWYMAYEPGYDSSQRVEKLSILDTSGASFPILASVDVDQWASLRDAKLGRALFSVPGGLLVVNVQTATAPYAQAYFPVQGWPTRTVVANGDVYMPAGSYGMYRFDIDEFNLLARAQ